MRIDANGITNATGGCATATPERWHAQGIYAIVNIPKNRWI